MNLCELYESMWIYFLDDERIDMETLIGAVKMLKSK